MDQWLQDLRAKTRQMTLTGNTFNNVLVSRLAIRTLTDKFESLIRILTHGDKYPTMEEIIISVEKDQALFKTRTEPKDKIAIPAGKETQTCYSCGKIGHLSKNCQKKMKTIKKGNSRKEYQKLMKMNKEKSLHFLLSTTIDRLKHF
ncbi:hypothetical protein O181_022164 [Austropuccinia psidii MF-1]|uniref:CCHC-type domain-containing protein n=1 Tax=Austropuccinia psidii MF-1 TaxID=1389203 RepID=A0A9Q3CE95_9BASI|nr:hypothetical protein [Austropuccinia psidii MF-1]